jgi:hypothetical protein
MFPPSHRESFSMRPFRLLSALAISAAFLLPAVARAGVLEGRPVNYVLHTANGVTYQMDILWVDFDGNFPATGNNIWTISSGSTTVDINDKKDLKELKAAFLKAIDNYSFLDITYGRSDCKILPGVKVDMVVYRDR